MSKIDLHIDASVIAQGLALEPSRVQAMMRKGEITSVCERGVNASSSTAPEPSSSGRSSTSAIDRCLRRYATPRT
jgi:hypothetical protein